MVAQMTKLGMALSFIYLAFVRILQLVLLCRRDSDELAVEVHTRFPCSSSGRPTGPRCGRDPAGRSSFESRRLPCWPATSSPWTQCC